MGKVFLENPDDVRIPIPEGFVFRGDDRDNYKLDKSNMLLETYTEGDVFNFASMWLNLPPPEKVLADIERIL